MRRPAVTVAHLSALLVASAAWMLTLGVTAALAAAPGPAPLPERLGGVALAAFTALQIGGIASFSVVAAQSLRGGARDAFPLRVAPRVPLRWHAAAVGCGLVTFLVGAAVGTVVAEGFGLPPSVLTLLEGLLSGGPVADRVAVALAVGVSAPLFEEIVFRGYVWRVVELGFGPIAAWFGSSLLFALYHLDPVQSVAVLPVALVLGWLRLRSGSVAPAVVAHLVHNAAGVALAVGGAAAGLVALGAAALVCVVAAASYGRSSSSS